MCICFKKAYFYLLLLIGLFQLLCETTTAEDDLQQNHRQVVIAFEKMKIAVSGYHRMPCLTPQSVGRLEAMFSAAGNTVKKLNSSYFDLTTKLASSIDGSGKYNKAFQKIADASENRKRVLHEYELEFDKVVNAFEDVLIEKYVVQEVDVLDNSRDRNCAKASFKLDDYIMRCDKNIVAKINKFRERLKFERDRFEVFRQENSVDSEKAGALDPNLKKASIPGAAGTGEGAQGFTSKTGGISEAPARK